ncbi:MAG: S9 family peptidase [Proteobacteria bacterium]|nr:S9 family peptidase [Pseudomonadota bacterium]
MIRSLRGAACAAALSLVLTAHGAAVAAEAPDPFLWLEDVDDTRALDWVRAENAKTQGVLEQDPRYATLYRDALAITQAKDRLPMPAFVAGQVYNFWQDAEHVHGIWRRTTLADYRQPAPSWTTVLDLDALSAAEHGNWFWHGAECLRPAERLCLVSLSEGGEDAVTLREFDTGTGHFVDGGFVLPKSKQGAVWAGADALLVARDWGAGTMTASGYPFVVKQLARGAPLTAAREVYRGRPDDVFVFPLALEDGAGHRALIVERAVSFFEHEHRLVGPGGPALLALPRKSDLEGLVDGRLLVRLNESWTAAGRTLPAGALVALDLAAAEADPAHLKPTLVFRPGPRSALGEVAVTRGHLILTSTENVRGRAAIYTPGPGGRWSVRTLAVPDMSAVDVAAADLSSEAAVIGIRGFLTPSTLSLVDAAAATLEPVKALPAQFDASRHVVEQREAVSTDGTRVPYFIVRPREQRADGSGPTILNAYGGFQVSRTPTYSGTLGKLWLERGGTFVLANIRGGGEFGPAWHEAGLKTHRQRIFDDFAAVARDLIRRGVTSPRRLGIEGGSNGGLLMGVEMTQHPELWRAVDIQVPLLDMLRYEQIAAGPSWVGEYGSVSVPAERAFLERISPYQQLKQGVDYPLPLIWTTTRDDRVGPQHARKFAARLAALGRPYYYYEVIEGGHAAGAKLEEKAHTAALEMVYFTRRLMD